MLHSLAHSILLVDLILTVFYIFGALRKTTNKEKSEKERQVPKIYKKKNAVCPMIIEYVV